MEAFSLRGLGHLGKSWKEDLPFPGDNAFGEAVANYRENIIQRYSALADQQGLSRDAAAWFSDHRNEIEKLALNPYAQAASIVLLGEYERTPPCIEALGALNRWPGRAGIPINDYLHQWEASCAELEASPFLPNRLRDLLGVGKHH